MSIQTQIDRITQNVSNTYSVLSDMGATIPEEQNTDNLPGTAANITAVLYGKAQSLTDEQKAQAKANIGLEGDYISSSDLAEAITDALSEAKASGEFKGEKGDPGVSGVYVGPGDMPEGYNVQIDPDGDLSLIPVRGVDYWTEGDKAEMISDVLAALPIYNGEVERV